VVGGTPEKLEALPTNKNYCNSALCTWAVLYQLRTICCASLLQLLLLGISSSAAGVEGRGRDVPLGFTGLAGGDSLDISVGKVGVEGRSWGLSANKARLIWARRSRCTWTGSISKSIGVAAKRSIIFDPRLIDLTTHSVWIVLLELTPLKQSRPISESIWENLGINHG
jgi:hypothetical protein